MSSIGQPHGGGALKPLLLEGGALISEQMRARALPRIGVSSREAADLLLFGIGAYTPLEGFMGQQDWRSVCDDLRLATGPSAGVFWPLPITMSTDEATAEHIFPEDEISLYDPERDEILATMRVTEKYSIDKTHECLALFGSADRSIPGVDLILRQDDINLAGPVRIISQSELPERYTNWYRTPAQVRANLSERGLHPAALPSLDPRCLSADALIRAATVAGGSLAIFSPLGGFGYGDGSAGARHAALEEAIARSGLGEGAIQVGHPPSLRPAGSRKTQLHALIWKNYGCDRMIFLGGKEASQDPLCEDEIPIAVLDFKTLLDKSAA